MLHPHSFPDLFENPSTFENPVAYQFATMLGLTDFAWLSYHYLELSRDDREGVFQEAEFIR
jgi:hypothetical protein